MQSGVPFPFVLHQNSNSFPYTDAPLPLENHPNNLPPAQAPSPPVYAYYMADTDPQALRAERLEASFNWHLQEDKQTLQFLANLHELLPLSLVPASALLHSTMHLALDTAPRCPAAKTHDGLWQTFCLHHGSIAPSHSQTRNTLGRTS